MEAPSWSSFGGGGRDNVFPGEGGVTVVGEHLLSEEGLVDPFLGEEGESEAMQDFDAKELVGSTVFVGDHEIHVPFLLGEEPLHHFGPGFSEDLAPLLSESAIGAHDLDPQASEDVVVVVLEIDRQGRIGWL